MVKGCHERLDVVLSVVTLQRMVLAFFPPSSSSLAGWLPLPFALEMASPPPVPSHSVVQHSMGPQCASSHPSPVMCLSCDMILLWNAWDMKCMIQSVCARECVCVCVCFSGHSHFFLYLFQETEGARGTQSLLEEMGLA